MLGRYRVVRPLARGGMGVVYLGRVEGSAGFAKPVVIKSVIGSFGSTGESEQMFAREARIVANLQHPGIVAVIDFGKVESSQVMVLEYVHGYHLGQWLRFVKETRGDIPVPYAMHVIFAVLDALAFAHSVARADGKSLGIVHRDVSPANVLIDVRGHVKLSDFGIARSADDEFKTQAGLFRGTLPYSPPEGLQGDTPSPAFDQYGAAVVLYQLLTGTNPFKGVESTATVTRVLTHVPPPVSTIRPEVPIAIEAALGRALQKDPADRFPSIDDFSRALRDGCTWSERETAESFAKQIEADFNGSLAEKLELESLAVRESSWRDAQGVTQTRRVSLSSTPPALSSGVVAQASSANAASPRDEAELPTARVGQTKRQELPAPPPTQAQAPLPAGRKPWIWIVLAALAAGAGSAAVLAFAPLRDAPKTTGVVVIEKQNEPAEKVMPPEEPAAPGPALPAAPAPIERAPTASAPASKALARAPSGGGGAATLAQAFQRQSGKIQRCFEQSTETVQGISVRFQIDTDGKVKNAVVAPPSVGATPLGACIAGVARATNFGPQPEPVAFSIPIAARVVKR